MKNVLVPVAFLVLLLGLRSENTQAQDNPTWSEDIACIVYSHCTSCHNDNGIAPFSLTSYDAVQAFGGIIDYAVGEKIMPPWPADPEYRHFQDENALTAEEIDLIRTWIANGSPEGDPDLAPEPPNFTSQYDLEDPDMVMELPLYQVPPLADKDLYRCFVVPSNFTEDKFITEMEVVPGNKAVVHHVLVYFVPNDDPVDLDNNDPEPGYTCFGGVKANPATLVGGWVPGAPTYRTPSGSGIKVPAGANFVVQVHYPDYGAGEFDSTTVRLTLEEGNMREITNLPILNHGPQLENGPLYIPAGTKREFTSTFDVPLPVTLFSIFPHAHLICESMKAYAVTPAGDTIPLVDIPKWDFDWQKNYYFKEAVVIPPGSKLYGHASYNNTPSNPHNPNNPPQDVWVGEATTDEMLLFYFSFAFTEAGDQNMVFDDSDHFPHFEDCEPISTSVTQNIPDLPDVAVFPNPAENQLFVRFSDIPEDVVIRSIHGKTVKTLRVDSPNLTLNVEDLSPGIYLLEAHYPQGHVIRKVAVQ